MKAKLETRNTYVLSKKDALERLGFNELCECRIHEATGSFLISYLEIKEVELHEEGMGK